MSVSRCQYELRFRNFSIMSDRGSPLLLRYYRRVEYEIGASYTSYVYTPYMHIRCVDTRKVWLCPSLHDYNLYGGNADRSASLPLSFETVYRMDKKENTIVAG